MPPTPIEQRLSALHAHYTSQVNAAVAAGRFDLVQDLTDACENEALELMITLEGDVGGSSEIEILELGGWPPRANREVGVAVRRRRFWPHRRRR